MVTESLREARALVIRNLVAGLHRATADLETHPENATVILKSLIAHLADKRQHLLAYEEASR